MDNKEAITTLNVIKFLLDNDQYTDDVESALDMAIAALEKQEKDRWIPVSEALPKEKAEYNVSIKGDYGLPPYVDACYWNDNDNVFEDWNGYYEDYIPVSNVIAWRPLPEPYQEDKA